MGHVKIKVGFHGQVKQLGYSYLIHIYYEKFVGQKAAQNTLLHLYSKRKAYYTNIRADNITTLYVKQKT
jgi:hypothetical protein